MSEALKELMGKHAAASGCGTAWRQGEGSVESLHHGAGSVICTIDDEGREHACVLLSVNWNFPYEPAAAFTVAAHNTLPQVAADFAALRAERDAAVKRAEAAEALANHRSRSKIRAVTLAQTGPEWEVEEQQLIWAAEAAGAKLDGDA